MTTAALHEIDVAAPRRKWPQYPGYKPTDVAWLTEMPSHWKIKRLRYAVSFPSKGEVRGIVPDTIVSFLPMEAVGEYGGLALDQTRQIEDVLNGYTYFRNADVLVAKITPCFENGKGALADGLENGIGFGTTELHVLRAGREILPRFLFYLTLGEHFRKLGTAEMYGAGGQKRVPERFLQNLRHPLPPLDEQRAIAAFLDRETARIDELIAKKQRLIELLKEKRQAVISRAVSKGLDPKAPMKPSGIDWLGDVPEHWSIAPLYARFWLELGKMLDAKQITGEHLVPYLRNVDVQWDYVNMDSLPEMDIEPHEYRRFILAAGDLLVCEGGEVGRTAIWKGELPRCAYQKALHRLRPRSERENTRYLFYALRHAAGTQVFIASGNPNTIPHLTGEQLRVYRFPFPPADEQTSIAEYLDRQTSEYDQLAAKVQRAIDRLNRYRSALITAAVTGQIDVRQHGKEAI